MIGGVGELRLGMDSCQGSSSSFSQLDVFPLFHWVQIQ